MTATSPVGAREGIRERSKGTNGRGKGAKCWGGDRSSVKRAMAERNVQGVHRVEDTAEERHTGLEENGKLGCLALEAGPVRGEGWDPEGSCEHGEWGSSARVRGRCRVHIGQCPFPPA